MAHEDKGHYAAKHEDKEINEAIAEKIKKAAVNKEISCTSAHQIAKNMGIEPLEVGVQIDLLEFCITECQLGLFGYGDPKKKLDPDVNISFDLDRELDNNQADGRISCLDCWDMATRLKIKRLDMGSACEKKNIRIKPCQLGAF